MSEATALAVNPETGRKANGQFAKGHTLSPKHRSPRAITQAIRAIAADDKVTEESLKLLVNIVKGKANATVSEQIKAAQFLMTQFTTSAKDDNDREIAEEGNAAISDMFNALKEMQK